MDINEIKADVVSTEKAVAGMPKWRLVIYAIILAFAVFYLCWSCVKKPAPAAGTPVKAAPAVDVAKVGGPVLHVPLQVVPKPAVVKKFPALAQEVNDPEEEVVDTADIPAETAEDGVQTVTFMNVSTGTASTVYVPKPAPWFSLEDKNAVGAAYLATTAGPAAVAYYRRDVLRVKNLHVGVVAGVGEVAGKAAAGAGIVGEYRW